MTHTSSSQKTHLYAPVHLGDIPDPASWAEILPGLAMGGTADGSWIDSPAALIGAHDTSGFDAVVTLFAWAQPMGWGVEELRYGFADADPAYSGMLPVVAAATWAHERWVSGKSVLIRCQAGLNRSGLVTALVLMFAGHSVDEAVALIRERRSPVALCNSDFIDWLVEVEDRATLAVA